MNKRRWSAALAAALLLVAEGAVFAQTAGDFSVTLTEDGAGVVIKGYTGSVNAVRIPATIEGMPVREIGRESFMYKWITSVVIPNGVTSIGDNAFSMCGELTSVTIPNSVTSIGAAAFYMCGSLTSVVIPDSVTSLGNVVFSDSGLTTISWGKGLAVIPKETFSRCRQLTKVVIPEGVTEIGELAFSDCVTLSSVTLPSTIKKIEHGAFSQCEALASVTAPASVTAVEFGSSAFSTSSYFGQPSRLNLASQALLKKLGYKGNF
ncbi:MAG: leucine-rich repeat domain-containing protein [Spirochaetaceae bacterium]|jgi:hypothetical protein|nr:leucine-rich repeat domain-containing protein [Spirochaetaceae bacterium]